MMSVHVDDIFMAVSSNILEDMKEIIKLSFNVQEFRKVRKFLGVFYK